jgi:mannitol-1-phosphate 5-dehydrogenase
MRNMGAKTFLGFGFGAIQCGLMLYEAAASGSFDRFLVSEVDRDLVRAVRRNGNSITINIARRDGIEKARLEDVEIFNPLIPEDRERIAEGIKNADEMATAIPNVSLYTSGGACSIAALLAENVDPEKPQVLYAAENNNYAAEILKKAILQFTGEETLERFHIANTVIGKMSGIIQGKEAVEEMDLEPITPDLPRAILVEEFNRILISKIPGVERGITVFREKDDLLPFEEAKLYGHNAIHSLIGYISYLKGYRVMSEAGRDTELLSLASGAFIDESGAFLIRKHGASGDPLFTPEGFKAYAFDLLERMVNPYLHDQVARICRDPVRKLGFSDRLFGAMREALKQGIQPYRLAQGALAGLKFIAAEDVDLGIPPSGEEIDETAIGTMLEAIWKNDTMDRYKEKCIELVLSISSAG